MDNSESVQTTGNSIIKHIFRYDDETKTTLMNLAQYTLLATVPVAVLQNISERFFPSHDPSKGTIELLIEIVGQALTTMVGLFFIHRIITAVPTFSGSAMGDLNLFNIMVVFLLTSFMFDGKIEHKIKEIGARTIEVWDGKSRDSSKKGARTEQANGSHPVVSVSQPISRGGAPTHQASRADYVGTHANMAAPTQAQGPPPSVPVQQAPPSIADQSNYAGVGNGAGGFKEPFAFSSGGGGQWGGNFASV